jgi:hypothetical protein
MTRPPPKLRWRRGDCDAPVNIDRRAIERGMAKYDRDSRPRPTDLATTPESPAAP